MGMRRAGATCAVVGLLLSLGLGAAAAPAAAPGTTAFEITEIGVGSRAFVALHNLTEGPASLRGLHLCQGKQCFALPNARVKAGATVRIARGAGTGLKNVVARRATFGKLRPAHGEVALFASSTLKSRDTIRDYLQWGSTPHALTNVAIAAGLWLKGSYAPTSPTAVRLYRTKGGLWVFK